MSTIIAHKDLEDFKAREDDFLEDPNHHSGVISGAKNSLYLFKDIVDSDQDILVTPRRWEGPHEMHTPYIKDLNFSYVV